MIKEMIDESYMLHRRSNKGGFVFKFLLVSDQRKAQINSIVEVFKKHIGQIFSNDASHIT